MASRQLPAAGEADRHKGDSLPDGAEGQQWYRKALDLMLRGEKIDLGVIEAASLPKEERGQRIMMGCPVSQFQ